MIKMTSDMLSQEEIDALLRGDTQSSNDFDEDKLLSDIEEDALGEIGNISMGTSATTLFALLGQKVTITTPKVTITNADELAKQYPIPYVAVDVKYKIGLRGANLLILKTDDVKVITDLMMGGDGTNTDRELNEMDLSAISEAMNQMVGSACTSLSEMFSNKIDIEPPRAFEISFTQGLSNFDYNSDNINDPLVKISFKMVVGNLIDSEIMQIIPISFAKEMVANLLNSGDSSNNNQSQEINISQVSQTSHTNDYDDNYLGKEPELPRGARERYSNAQEINMESAKPVNVKKPEFQSFDIASNTNYNSSIELIQEIPIEITVELGRTHRKISEILEYGPGTIIELDKLVGEPLEVFANGKFIAKGEVVVIDDNFGIRITDIINKANRVSKI